MTPAAPAAESGAARLVALSPLLESIAQEIEERAAALELLLARRAMAAANAGERARLDAECSAHRHGLRRARLELESLGCILVSTRPCSCCIALEQDGGSAVVFWRRQKRT